MNTVQFFISLLFVVNSCSTRNTNDRVYQTAHFKILYTALDDDHIKGIADSLENSYPRITEQLQSGELSAVTVHFYENATELHRANPNIPVWATGLATSVSDIHIISPNNPALDYKNMIRNAIHEFAHCASMKINSTIPNNPRWLWESVALYEANLPWDPHTLSYLVNEKPPALHELSEFSNTLIYEVGYFVAQFIVEVYGRNTLTALIKNNGNLKESLNMDEEEFTRNWFAFVKKKYGL